MLILNHASGSMKHQNTTYFYFGVRDRRHIDGIITKVTSCELIPEGGTLLYHPVSYLGFQFLTLREDASQPVVWTIMFMLWHVPINSEDLANAPYFPNRMNTNFLSWLLNVETSNLRIPRCRCLFLDGNPKGHELLEQTATKVEVNPRMLSTLKNI